MNVAAGKAGVPVEICREGWRSAACHRQAALGGDSARQTLSPLCVCVCVRWVTSWRSDTNIGCLISKNAPGGGLALGDQHLGRSVAVFGYVVDGQSSFAELKASRRDQERIKVLDAQKTS